MSLGVKGLIVAFFEWLGMTKWIKVNTLLAASLHFTSLTGTAVMFVERSFP
jgi:hypothetical protein